MPSDITGNWHPPLAPKQIKVYNSYARSLLVSGPRLSGKTRAVLHRVVKHLYETPGARVAMFARTLKSTHVAGSWNLLHRDIIPVWMNSQTGVGMKYTTEVGGIPGPKTEGLSRTPVFRVTNCHGGESEMMLFSMEHDQDAEAKLKEMEASMIYFSELDKFFDRRVLTVALPSLRMGHLKYEQQMWLADCNPSEEGEDSWIYKEFYLIRNMTYEQYVSHQRQNELPVLPEVDFTDVYRGMDVIEILPRDNPYIDQRQLQEVRVSCGADLGLYARLVEGKWVWGGGDASRHFRVAFKETAHVIGHAAPNMPEEDWIIALPGDNTLELITGWDLGDVNHSAHILDRYECDFKEKDPSTGKEVITQKYVYVVLDENVSIGEEISHSEFTGAFMEKVSELEQRSGKGVIYNLQWHSWSDNSSFKFNAAAGAFPHLTVAAASDDRINLQAADKGKESVRVRVKLLKDLLAQGRLKVSANCFKTIKMFKDLKKGTTATTFVVPDENKHVFDSLSYALLMECKDEFLKESINVGRKREPLIMSV